MQTWQDTYSVRRVFGEPVDKGGVVVIPVAQIGGGEGVDRAGEDAGGTESAAAASAEWRGPPASTWYARTVSSGSRRSTSPCCMSRASRLARSITLTLVWALGRKR